MTSFLPNTPKEYFWVLGVGGFPVIHWTFLQHHAEACRGEGKYPKASTYAHVPQIPPALPASMALLLQALDYFPKIKDTQPFMEFVVISFLRGWFMSIELDKHIEKKKKLLQIFRCSHVSFW